jgi:hypothetical protein
LKDGKIGNCFDCVANNLVKLRELNLTLTVCPCANQPDEKFTAPGSSLCLELFLIKFLSCIRQFGEGFMVLFFWIDLFSKGPMLMVAWLTPDCF